MVVLSEGAPRECRKQLLEKTTATAIGAMRRSHGGALATEAVGLKPPALHSAEKQSVWREIERERCRGPSLTTAPCPVIREATSSCE
jgi:hypothetical protein